MTGREFRDSKAETEQEHPANGKHGNNNWQSAITGMGYHETRYKSARRKPHNLGGGNSECDSPTGVE